MDSLEIANEIFKKSAQKPHSIRLEFEENDVEYMFKELVLIFTQGCKMLYGDSSGKVDLSKMTDSDFSKLNEYFHSFGINLIYNINQQPKYIDNRQKLCEHYLRLRVSNITYYLSFDFLPVEN